MTERKTKDVYVALMGLTGAGKSSFINHCTKQEVLVGDGLQACTDHVAVYSFCYSPGITIHLVDTPGFDDTNRQDSDVLRDISAWLSKSYTEKVLLNGILYLHRISDPRMQGSGKMSINLLIKLCGRDVLKNVVLVTTMWELVEPDVGDRREEELESTEEFWGFMKRHGSHTRRHHNNEESARKILSMFVPETPGVQPETVALAIQKELADDHKSLDQTGAGQLLDGTWAKEKQALQRELEEVRDAVKTANEERDHALAQMLQDQQREMSETVENIKKEQERLRVTMEELHVERLSKYQKMLDEQMELARTLSRDLESKEKIQEMAREEHEVLIVHHKDKLQEQQITVSDLQGQLDGMDLSPDPPKDINFLITDLPGNAMSLAFSSDGKRLFAGTGKKKIYIFDQQPNGNWDQVQILRCCSFLSSLSSTSDDTIDCFVLSSDDSFLIAACGDRMLRFVVDPSNKLFKYDSYRHTNTGSSGDVGLMALSFSDECLVFSGRRDCRDIHIWKLNCGIGRRQIQALGRFPMLDIIGQDALVTCLAFGKDDQLAIGLDNGTLCVLNAMGSNGELVSCFAFESFKGTIFSVAWTHNSHIVIGTDRGIFVRSSEGIVKQAYKTDIMNNSDWWMLESDEGQIYYGAYRGQTGQGFLDEDRYIAMEGPDFPLATGPLITISDTLISVQFACGGPGALSIQSVFLSSAR